MYYSTGLTVDEVGEVYDLVKREYERSAEPVAFPPVLGLYLSMVIALISVRTNQTQAEIGEARGWSQSTISRAITSVTPLLAKALAVVIPTAEDVDLSQTIVVDGTLVPCWSWRDHLRAVLRQAPRHRLQPAGR